MEAYAYAISSMLSCFYFTYFFFIIKANKDTSESHSFSNTIPSFNGQLMRLFIQRPKTNSLSRIQFPLSYIVTSLKGIWFFGISKNIGKSSKSNKRSKIEIVKVSTYQETTTENNELKNQAIIFWIIRELIGFKIYFIFKSTQTLI